MTTINPMIIVVLTPNHLIRSICSEPLSAKFGIHEPTNLFLIGRCALGKQ